MLIRKIIVIAGLFFMALALRAQVPPGYWQQQVDYTMEVAMNVDNYKYSGTQKLIYTNNSPDTLKRVFYHMYPNAFQPGSEMDLRVQHITDPDSRLFTNGESRIANLSPSEIGYLRATSLKQDGNTIVNTLEDTVLEVVLKTPLPPGGKTTFEMVFEGQVPVQIRRSGRNNSEGVALSMSQWYPKMAEYDFEGWHADAYIAREFHGVWGDFDVKLTIDKNYIVGGTGYLQNPDEIGHGYQATGVQVKKPKGKTLTWHFKAPMVHDFMWAADPEYIHDKVQVENGPVLHFLYKNDPNILENWKNLQPKTVEALHFLNKNIGLYPYEQYSLIQGGDGGMEYAMGTIILGRGSFNGLVGLMVHEIAHSWFQHVLANNELKHGWMDEGFTEFIETLCTNKILEYNRPSPFGAHYAGYYAVAGSGKEQPLTTHADRYNINYAYGNAIYNKGAVFLAQLGYIIGQDKLMETLRKYYADFKFKHPTPNDFKRTAEKVSGIHLDWYLTDWTQTTNTIDYGIKEVSADGENTNIILERIGLMPMPLDILLVLEDNSQLIYYAPLRMMRGEKDNPYPSLKRTVIPDWPWASPTYIFSVDIPINQIKAVVLDPSQLMADINSANNIWQPKTGSAKD